MRKVIVITSVLAAAALGADELPGWVVACEVLPDEESAQELVEELESYRREADRLWIPAWPSLSGYEGWLVYLGPFGDEHRAAGEACGFLWRYPDSYAVYAGPEPERRTAPPEPTSRSELLGIFPPGFGSFYPQEELPPGWDVEWTYPDLDPPDRPLEEWEQPAFVRAAGFGWETESWVDCYAGVVEKRAVRRVLPGERLDDLYAFCRDFLVKYGEALTSRMEEREGEWLLLSVDPNPEVRVSDIEFWLYRRPDALEYGWSVRAFYGETPSCRPWLPAEAVERPF
jgi:hypothetical protein